MQENNTRDFIVIDDDFINNVICETVIKKEFQGMKIDIFTIPKKGIEYINTTYSKPDSNDAVVFLDINMPALNGWDVLDELNSSPEQVQQHLSIFILSSSLTPEDKQKADAAPLVSGYIEKPLKISDLNNIIAT